MILVVGATGALGGHMTTTLLEQGQDVRAMVRSRALWDGLLDGEQSSAAWSLVEAGANTVQGDLKNRVSMRAAISGVDTVIAGATAFRRHGEDTIETVDFRGTLDLIKNAADAGVRRFVYISMLGADSNHPLRLLQIKATCEQALKQSGMNYLIVRPALFMETWIPMMVKSALRLREPVYLSGRGDLPQHFISEKDAAKLILTMMADGSLSGRIVPLVGPEAYSWNEIVRQVGQETGVDLAIQYQLPGLPLANVPAEVSAILGAQPPAAEIHPLGDRFGVRLTPLKEFIQRQFAIESPAWPVTPGLSLGI